MSHLGRPGGERNLDFSNKPCVNVLSSLLGKPVTFLDDCVGKSIESHVNNATKSEVILLENVRFHPEETGSGN